MPKVIIWRDGAIETEFDPGHRNWRMGRSETNDITLLDPRKSVSRFHAELREENGRWVFIDLNSQNGSWKDGQRVNRLVLEHGHEVLFGDYRMAFEDPVLRAPVKPKPTRKGINPLILVLFLSAMLGAAAAVAWKVLSSDPAEPRVADGSEATPPETVPEPVLVTRYDDGRRALAAGRFAEAERDFAAVLAEQPAFRDTTALLAQARGGQAAAREASLTEARALEASGDWPRAIAAYERAGASDGADGARTKMTAAGDDAYRKARQFDARNRPIDAMTWYQRAAAWLPDSDPRKVAAQERLTALKGGGE